MPARCTELKGKISGLEDKSEDIQKGAWRDEGRGNTERRHIHTGRKPNVWVAGVPENATETVSEKKAAENFT